MSNGYIPAPSLKTNALAKPDTSKKTARRHYGRQRSQAAVDSRSVVAGNFMRMSEAHDHIRMKILAAGAVRNR